MLGNVFFTFAKCKTNAVHFFRGQIICKSNNPKMLWLQEFPLKPQGPNCGYGYVRHITVLALVVLYSWYHHNWRENQNLIYRVMYKSGMGSFRRFSSLFRDRKCRWFMDVRAGWEITDIIDAPLSTQRFQPRMVSRMQKNRTLEMVRRSLIMGRKK